MASAVGDAPSARTASPSLSVPYLPPRTDQQTWRQWGRDLVSAAVTTAITGALETQLGPAGAVALAPLILGATQNTSQLILDRLAPRGAETDQTGSTPPSSTEPPSTLPTPASSAPSTRSSKVEVKKKPASSSTQASTEEVAAPPLPSAPLTEEALRHAWNRNTGGRFRSRVDTPVARRPRKRQAKEVHH